MQNLEIAPFDIMSLQCDKLLIFESSSDSVHRYLTYRTSDGKEVIIVEQKWSCDDEWKTSNHIMIPAAFLPNMFSNGHLTANTEICPQTVEEELKIKPNNIIHEYEVDDYGTLTLNVRKIFFQYECKRVPCFSNQLHMWADIEALEKKWSCEEIGSPNGYNDSTDQNGTVSSTSKSSTSGKHTHTHKTTSSTLQINNIQIKLIC